MNQQRSVLDVPIFHKMYNLYKILSEYQGGIPKVKRYTLWQLCENISLSLLVILIRTGNQKEEKKLETLYEISNNIDLLKVLMRLAKETKIISLKQYIVIQEILQEIGKMTGGWIKFTTTNK